MINMPKFSFVVPCFNSEKTIRRCLDSIRNQTFNDFECVIVNDGSTDSTKNILSEYVSIDNRFKLCEQKNKGTSAATNLCIEKASGEYIVPVDHDDWIDKNLLAFLFKAINVCNDFDIIGFHCTSYPPSSSTDVFFDDENKPLQYSFERDGMLDLSFNKSRIHLTHTSTCIRKSIFKDVYFLGHGYGADTVVMSALIHKAKSICVINKILYFRTNSPYSVSRSKLPLDVNISTIERIIKHLHVFKNPLYDNPRELDWVYDSFLDLRVFVFKHPYLFFRLTKCGTSIYANKSLFIPKSRDSFRTFVLLVFPFIPLRSGRIPKK